MQMTNEEIVRDYTQAANKQKQVRILADLNLVSPSEIRTILATAGVEGVKMPEKIMPRKKPRADAEAAPAAPAADIYAWIDTILSALPENASAFVRDTARNLAVALFREDLERRLGKAGGGDETD